MGETFADISLRRREAARKRKVAERGRRELRGEKKAERHIGPVHVSYHNFIPLGRDSMAAQMDLRA